MILFCKQDATQSLGSAPEATFSGAGNQSTTSDRSSSLFLPHSPPPFGLMLLLSTPDQQPHLKTSMPMSCVDVRTSFDPESSVTMVEGRRLEEIGPELNSGDFGAL